MLFTGLLYEHIYRSVLCEDVPKARIQITRKLKKTPDFIPFYFVINHLESAYFVFRISYETPSYNRKYLINGFDRQRYNRNETLAQSYI